MYHLLNDDVIYIIMGFTLGTLFVAIHVFCPETNVASHAEIKVYSHIRYWVFVQKCDREQS